MNSSVLSISPSIYREYADEYKKLARSAFDEPQRALYLKMALTQVVQLRIAILAIESLRRRRNGVIRLLYKASKAVDVRPPTCEMSKQRSDATFLSIG